MVVPSMSNLERCNALYDDLPKLKIHAEKIRPKITKEIKQANKYPCWKWIEYNHSTSKNKYLIYFYVQSVKDLANPFIDFINISEGDQRIIIKWGCWPLFVKEDKEVRGTRFIAYFHPHFFTRYRERAWLNSDMPFYELLCRYFSRNQNPHPIELNDNIKRAYSEYGEYASMAFNDTDGLCLINLWNEGDINTVRQRDGNFISVVCYNTFLSRSVLNELQNKALIQEDIRYLQKFYSDLSCFINGDHR